MKKIARVLFVLVTVIGVSTVNGLGKNKVAYASPEPVGASRSSRQPAMAQADKNESFNVQFSYEMAQITAQIVSFSSPDVAGFKARFAYAAAQTTAKVMPILPEGRKKEFAYQMARMTTRIISDPNLNIEEAKAAFAYEIAQLTTKIIMNEAAGDAGESSKKTLLRNDAAAGRRLTGNESSNSTGQQAAVSSGHAEPENYSEIVDQLTQIGDRRQQQDNKVNIDGEVRYHYASDRGPGQRDSSGFRLRLGADAEIAQDWRVHGMLEGRTSVVNYNNDFKLSRLYAAGTLGQAAVRAGSFGYLMAEGNIYDSVFDGVRTELSGPVDYTAAYGKTDDSKETVIATARYHDYDYDVEAGVYHYRTDGLKNTIRTLGGNYYFSNFSLGAMALDARRKDAKGDGSGYVLSFNYGDLKSWRPGTYGIFAKYYNQPRHTYIVHGMNGAGRGMQGFKGYGLGVDYTVAENFIAGIEYYDQTDKISGEKAETWWSRLTRYF